MIDTVRSGWQFIADRWAVEQQPEPSTVLIVALATIVAVAIPRVWKPLRQASTIIHEMGHVLAAWATGRRVSGIKLHTDTSGVTVSAGKPRGFGMLATTLAGYPAPGVLAVLMATLLSFGNAGAALTVYQAVVAVALLLSRNVTGIVSCLISLVATGLVWWHNDATVVTYTVVALSTFYAIAGVRGTLDLIHVHAAPSKAKRQEPERVPELKEKARTTDAGQAARAWWLVPLPGLVWLGIFVVVSVLSGGVTVWLLVH